MAKAPGVLRGGKTIKVGNNYYQVYEFPAGSGNWISYQWDSLEQATQAFGTEPRVLERTEQWFNAGVIAQGDAEEVVGAWTSWSLMMDETMQEAALEAGLGDPTVAGQIVANPEMMQILAQAVVGDWTPAQIIAEQRKTDFWQNVLYPGIEHFYGQTAEPEKAYADYMSDVTPALQALGYEPDKNGNYKGIIGRMLDKGIDSNLFLSQVPTFIQAVQNHDFAMILNRWAIKELGRDIKWHDWFDLLAGETQPELEGIAERAQLQWMAENQGTSITQKEIDRLAERTQLSGDEAQQVFSDFNRSILALGDVGLKRYGLTRDEVLSAAAGVDSAGGKTVDEVKMLVAKTARELALADDEKINFYVGFNQQGTPQRQGLAALAPEGA